MKFKLLKSDEQTKARAGEITTDHGKIQTPIFMPVGTGGTVKAVHQHELKVSGLFSGRPPEDQGRRGVVFQSYRWFKAFLFT